jgi:hypothetical protein
MVSKLSEIWSGLLIRDLDPDPDFLTIPDPGSRGQKDTRSRIPDPDPQHCVWIQILLSSSTGKKIKKTLISLVIFEDRCKCTHGIIEQKNLGKKHIFGWQLESH